MESLTPAEAPRATWHPLETVPVFLMAFVGTSLVAVAAPPSLQILVAALAFGFFLGGGTLLWLWLRHRGSFGALRIVGERPLRDALLGLGAGPLLFISATVLAVIVVTVVSAVKGHPIEVPPQVPVTLHSGALRLTITGIAVILSAPIGEELFFRGLLFGGLRIRFGYWPAALASSAFFAASHLDLLRALPLFVVGLGLAWVYERRSLVAAMATHATFNVLGLALLLFAPEVT